MGERDGAVEGDAGLIGPAEPHEQAAAHAVEVEISVERLRDLRQHRERVRGAAHLADRHRAVERDHGGGRQPLERRVVRIDLRPVGIFGARRVRVHARDRGLHLVGAGPAMPQRLLDQRMPFGDHVAIP